MCILLPWRVPTFQTWVAHRWFPSRVFASAELLIHSYFNIVKREMIDMVPKAISLTLVSHSKENLQRELLQELYKPEVLDDLLKESEFVVNRRKEVVSMIQALNKAEECVPGSLLSLSGADD